MSSSQAAPSILGEFVRYESPTWTDPHPVYVHGTGPAVVLIHELNGLTPEVQAFAERLSAEFTVYLPVLFGPIPATTKKQQKAAARACCVSKEITILRTGQTSPVVGTLRALAEDVPGERVGVIGMCMSGGFALALARTPPIAAAVASQPSLPFAVTPGRARDLGMSDAEVEQVRKRLDGGDVEVYVARFSDDRISPAARTESIVRRLGTHGVTLDVIPSGRRNCYGFRRFAHSVLAAAPAQYPTGVAHARLERAADEVARFLRRRLSDAGQP